MRILILSDVHGNLPALRAVLEAAGSCDALWNLGDTVGYGPWPNECAATLREWTHAIHLAGNHDLAAIGELDVRGFNAVAARAAEWTGRVLEASTRTWLASLPSRAAVGDIVLVHGSLRSPALEYILDDQTASRNLSMLDGRMAFFGHTHVPAIYADQDVVTEVRDADDGATVHVSLAHSRMLVNPGSVGQPRDGDPRAAFAILDDANWDLVLHRVPYPIEETQEAIRRAGLPEPLASRLAMGR